MPFERVAAVSAARQPYVNIFKHMKIEEWKKVSKEGDVSTYMDKSLKCSVFRVRGSIPASNYILLPKTSSQSLCLTGRYLYLLFRPSPNKHFIVHLDIAAEEGQVIRVSFSNMFKEFKSTATWLQFPFLCGAAHGLVGPAPPSTRWTCLTMDLHYVLSVYLNRTHSHLKSIKLCANMSVKNIITSLSFSEYRQSGVMLPDCTAPMPREMCFPVPKGQRWHDLYDYIRKARQSKVYMIKLCVYLQLGSFCVLWSFGGSLFIFQKLYPDPILKLNRIIGFGGATMRCAVWSSDGEEVVYPCHAVIVSMTVSSGQQRFFIGHTDKVSALALNTSSALLASAQMGTNSLIRLWSYSRGVCQTIIPTHTHALNLLSFSQSGGVLCGVGKDSHNKTTVVLWNTRGVAEGSVVPVLAKAHTDVDIQTMKIAFFNETRMVSCGLGNIRLWRVRGGSLRSCPVNLGQYHNLEFTDLAFEQGHSQDRPVDDRFVSSRSGHILEIDYVAVAIKNIRRLLPAQETHAHHREKQTFSTGAGIAVNSISVCDEFCVTGSEDGFMRLWPLDFSSVFLEAEHEGPVSLVCVSSDGSRVLAATTTGNLGYLDVSSRGYRTLMRSHTASVLGFSVDCVRRRVTTVSRDSTVRVWDMDTMQQLYDFVSDDDESPCSVAFHPSMPLFACGSSSGTVRVFDIQTSSLIAQHRYIHTLKHSFVLTNQHFFTLCNVVAWSVNRGPDTLAVSSDSRCLALIGPTEYIVTIMEAQSLNELLRVDVSILDVESTTLDSALNVCFSPTSLSHLLITTSANKILWIDTHTGQLLRQVHKHQCVSLAVSEDGRYLLTAGQNSLKVWDYDMHLDVNSQVFIGHSEPIRQVRFTPDQMGVVTVGDALFFWDFLAPPQEFLISSLCSDHSWAELNGAELSNESPRKALFQPSSPPVMNFLSSALKDTPPSGQAGLSLKAVIGYNGNGRNNMVWNPDTGLFVYTCGCVIVVEDLHTGSQKQWFGHTEEISTLAITHDAQTVASASGGGASHSSLICIWNASDGSCRNRLSYHKGAVQSLTFSRDDMYLLSVGYFSEPVVALWGTRSFELLCTVQISVPLHDASFCPFTAGELTLVGSSAVVFTRIQTQDNISLPDAVGEAEVTSLCYSTRRVLYTGTNSGHVCVWDCNTQRCFVTWEADGGEIGVLVCRENKLVTGSNTKKLRLWSVASSILCFDSGRAQVQLEQELLLDGTVVSAAFDDVMDMGIVGTTAGTLWYINWADSTSIRLISGHKSKVNGVVCSPDEQHFATCGQDGSVRVWALQSHELLVQFQVLNQSCECVCWSPPRGVYEPSGRVCVAGGYSDGTVRIFSLESAEMELKLQPQPVSVCTLQYSHYGHVLLSGGRDGLITVSSPVTGVTVRTIRDHKGAPITTVQCTSKQVCEFGLEGNELWLAVSSDRRVSIWAADWMKDKCELLDWLTFPAPSSPEDALALPPSLAAFSPSERGTVVYTGYAVEKEIIFYCLYKKQLIFSLHTLLVRVLKLIHSSSGRFQDFTCHSDSVHVCSFSWSGSQLFTAAHNELLLWTVHGL
uniref:WD repeat domain 90 n=1 Tax=Cyprinus carpio TaxID=7962 RepID=A0A8C1U243_CYPCA